jgi:hypothetical protein
MERFSKILTKNVRISSLEVKEYYYNNIKKYEISDKVHLMQIVTKDEKTALDIITPCKPSRTSSWTAG